MLKKVTDLNSSGFPKGLATNANILALSKDQTPNIMDVTINNDLSMTKRYGTMTQNAVIIVQSGGAGFSPDSSNSLLSNIIAYWKMDEPGGARQDIISTHTLQDNNTVTQVGGLKRFAANFVAANSQYLLINNTATLATGDVDFSMAASVYLNSTSTTIQRTIISKRDIGSGTDLVLLLHCDGADASTTFTDSSLSANAMTAVGTAQVDTAQSKFGGASLLLDGSTSYLSALDTNDWNFGTGDFTIDMQARWNSVGNSTLFAQTQDGSNYLSLTYNSGSIEFRVGLGVDYTFAFTPAPNTWYHIAMVRNGNNFMAFVDGAQIGTTQVSSSTMPNLTGVIRVGGGTGGAGGEGYMNGWLDEVRVIKGRAAWTANFTVPTTSYTNPSNASQYEYFLGVNTDNVPFFKVSSSGVSENATVSASSFGALGTATWYSLVAWHDTGDRIGISVNLSVNTASYASGLRSGSAPFVVGAISNGASNFFDGRIDEVGFWKKILSSTDRSNLFNLGTGNTYNLSFDRQPWASFDFGASNLRWATVAAGTGIYASSNLGVTWVNIATDRTATYQFFERSKASLIATSDAYDTPLQWAGSANTFATILNPSAPLAKYSVNFQGFLILLNSSTRKRGFFYEDENFQLTNSWANNFDIPSSADDEITGSIILRKSLYISTRYSLFRLTYIGGNPDWSYKKIKDFGYVPRTAKIISLKDVGEVAVGLDWNRHIRLFDGADDKIISTDVENDNGMCDFALEKISYALSGLTVSHALVNNDDTYKLCVAIGATSSTTTHVLNFDGRTSAFYPYSNTPFNTMVMAESANRRQLLAFDRSGYCHLVDSGNLDAGVSPVNDIFDSPFLFEKSPSGISKSQRVDLYMSPASGGMIHILDRVDFNSTFKHRDQFSLTNDGTKVQIKHSIDIPQTANVYQYRITSSAGTATPWTLNRIDYFLKSMGIGDSE